jgi:hypothetical protein
MYVDLMGTEAKTIYSKAVDDINDGLMDVAHVIYENQDNIYNV